MGFSEQKDGRGANLARPAFQDRVQEVTPKLGACRKDTERAIAILRKRDGDRCCWCGLVMMFTRDEVLKGRPRNIDVSIEHVVPLSEGGDSRIENLSLAHRGCNSGRIGSNRPSESAQARVRASLNRRIELSPVWEKANRLTGV